MINPVIGMLKFITSATIISVGNNFLAWYDCARSIVPIAIISKISINQIFTKSRINLHASSTAGTWNQFGSSAVFTAVFKREYPTLINFQSVRFKT